MSSEARQVASAFKEAVKLQKHGRSENFRNFSYPWPQAFPHWTSLKPSKHSQHVLGKLFDQAEAMNDTTWKDFDKNAKITPNLELVEISENFEKSVSKADYVTPLNLCHLLNFQQEHLKRQTEEVLNHFVMEIMAYIKSIDRQSFCDLLRWTGHLLTLLT